MLSVGGRAVDVALGAVKLATSPVTGALNFENVIADLSAIVAAGVEGVSAGDAQARLEIS